jgi:hypothetical protein
MWSLVSEGQKVERLSQLDDDTGLDELLTEEEQAITAWDDLEEAMGWALHHSDANGGQAVDVVDERGGLAARIVGGYGLSKRA